MKHLNIEIKARSRNHDQIRAFLQSRRADFRGRDHQIDTYFKVNNGRLKLREGNIENYLIYYQWEDKDGPKKSEVLLFESNPASPLKAMLAQANGILAVVDKQREIYFIDNVKFHLDIVEGLGAFVEIEAIDEDGSIGQERLREQCSKYLKQLKLEESDLISASYSDLLLNEAAPGSRASAGLI